LRPPSLPERAARRAERKPRGGSGMNTLTDRKAIRLSRSCAALVFVVLWTDICFAAPGLFVQSRAPIHLYLSRHQHVVATPSGPKGTPAGVRLIETGPHAVTVTNNGVVESSYGRGIWATQEGADGGIYISGSGLAAGRGQICPASSHPPPGQTGCSGIRAKIANPADPRNVAVDYNGNVSATSAAINAITAGPGDIAVRSSGHISGYEFGIEAKGHDGAIAMKNVGSIETHGDGVLAKGLSAVNVVNRGSIDVAGNPFTRQNSKMGGILAGISESGVETAIANLGRIDVSGGVGMLVKGSTRTTIINAGEITAPKEAIRIQEGGAVIRLKNTGRINGNVVVEGNNDHLVLLGHHHFNGSVIFSGVNDTLTYRMHTCLQKQCPSTVVTSSRLLSPPIGGQLLLTLDYAVSDKVDTFLFYLGAYTENAVGIGIQMPFAR
jgi:hypothetical protein